MKITAMSDQIIITMIRSGSTRTEVMEWLIDFYGDINGIYEPELDDCEIMEKYTDRLYHLIASGEPLEWEVKYDENWNEANPDLPDFDAQCDAVEAAWAEYTSLDHAGRMADYYTELKQQEWRELAIEERKAEYLDQHFGGDMPADGPERQCVDELFAIWDRDEERAPRIVDYSIPF